MKHIPCVVDDPQKLHQLRREVAIMQRISYDANVVQFYGACMSGEGAWLCMEYMEVCAFRIILTPSTVHQRYCALPALPAWTGSRCQVEHVKPLLPAHVPSQQVALLHSVNSTHS